MRVLEKVHDSWNKSMLSWQKHVMASNEVLTVTVKKHAKLDIIFLRSCPILLYFLTFCQIFCAGLQMCKIMKGMKYENVNLMHEKICQWKSATEIRRNQINLNTALYTQIQWLNDSIIRIMQSNLIDWLYKMITQCLFKVLKRHISFTFLQKVTKIPKYCCI